MEWTPRLAVIAGLLVYIAAGCSTPVGIRIADPREVSRYLTRSALSEGVPSDFSRNELRRFDLMDTYSHDPDAALAKLHTAAVSSGLPSDALFALAELSLLRAEKDEKQGTFAAAAIYAYAFLYPEDERQTPDALDPRARISADLYNRSLTAAFDLTRQRTTGFPASGVVPLPFGTLAFEFPGNALHLNGYELYDLQAVAEIEVRGLRNRYRQPGIGAPLAAKTRPLPGTVPIVPVAPLVRLPLTAVLRIDSPIAGIRKGELSGQLEVFASMGDEHVEIDGQPEPLESEPTAALAAGLSESRFWQLELQAFFGNALGARRPSQLFATRPYQKGRIPAVFVHGTASSPGRWADMVNDLQVDPAIRERYAFWLFSYDSGNPHRLLRLSASRSARAGGRAGRPGRH